MTAATAAAFHFFVAGHAAEFERLGNVLVHRFLDLMEILLGFDETGRDGIGDEGVAFLLVFGDFFAGKLHALLLLVLEVFALLGEVAIEFLGAIIGKERVDFAAQTLIARVLQNGFAEFAGFLVHQTILCNGGRHSQQRCSAAWAVSSAGETRLQREPWSARLRLWRGIIYCG